MTDNMDQNRKRSRDHSGDDIDEQQELSLKKKQKTSPFSPYKIVSAIASPFKALTSWIFTRPSKALASSQEEEPVHIKEETLADDPPPPELKHCSKTLLNYGMDWERSISPIPVRKPKYLDINHNRSLHFKNVNPDMSRELPKKNKKLRRHRPSVKARREMRPFQKKTHLLIPKMEFSQLVKEIAKNIMSETQNEDLKFQVPALECLQEATELYMVHLFEDALLFSSNEKRVKIMPKDILLATRLRARRLEMFDI